MSAIRQPAVSGQFYPGNPADLKTSITKHLNAVALTDKRIPKAIIAPHAGYVFSGPIAATAYKRLTFVRNIITRVVLLGPCHRVPVRGLALSSAEAFATPLGNIKLDTQAIAKISSLPQVDIFDETHRLEHSLEVHLPFLQTVLGAFTLVPLVVGEASPESVAEVLNAIWGKEETLIIVSSDLSHYLDYNTAKKIDAETSKAIESMDPDKIARQGACGRFPVGGLLKLAKQRGMTVDTVDLRNSGDTAGPKDRVVGYGAWLFYEPITRTTVSPKSFTSAIVWGRSIKRAPIVYREAEESKTILTTATKEIPTENDFGAGTRALLENHGFDLVLLAVTSINHGLRQGVPTPITLRQHTAELQEEGACFITLKRNGQLRGCIGSPQAHRPLIQDVADNAFKSAFKDPRFPPLKKEECNDLKLSIAVLSPQTPIIFNDEPDFMRQLRPGHDGLIIADGAKRALFLPAVWEQLSKTDLFVQHLKKKAGMAPKHWSPKFQAWRFITESICIDDFTDS